MTLLCNFRNDGNVLYLDLGDGSAGIYIYRQNDANY